MALKSGQDLCHLTNLPFKWASASCPLTCTHTAPTMDMHMLVLKSTQNLKKKKKLSDVTFFFFLEAYLNTTCAICASLVTKRSRHVFFHVCFKKIYRLPVRYILRQNLVHGTWVKQEAMHPCPESCVLDI